LKSREFCGKLPGMKTPEDILNCWVAAVNGKDIETLVGLYGENAVLLPTFSNRMFKDLKGIREYFQRLSQRNDLGVKLHHKPLMVQPIDLDKYALSGVYCWSFSIDGELFSFEARFSYILDMGLTRPIIHHHSSQIPRMI